MKVVMITVMVVVMVMMVMVVVNILHICHFFYTTTICGLEILHLKVRKCPTKVPSRQNSANQRPGVQIHTFIYV